MKKIIPKIAVCCCAFALSACAGSSGDEAVLPDGKLEKCTIRFSWWGGDDRHEATLKALEQWEKLHPDITVKAEYGGWDGWEEKVAAQMSGGVEPDLMQVNCDWLISMSPDGNGFYDLNKLTDTLDLSGFDEEVLSFGKVGGKLNAVTVSVSGRCLFYNSEVYKRLGASYPQTWDDLIALGSVFSGEGLYPLDLDIQTGGTAWYLAVVYVQQQTGKQFITMDGELGFTEDDIRLALDFYKKLEDEHVIRTVKSRTDEDGNAALYQSPEFIGGKIAGVLEWGSSVGKYEAVLENNVLEAGPLLSSTDGKSGGWMIKPSMLYAISKNTKHPDEAAALMDFLLNDKDCAEILGTTRGIPSSKYAEDALEASGKLTGLAQVSDEMLENTDTVTVSPYMDLTAMVEIYSRAIEEVSYNKTGTAEAAKQMYDSIKEYLERVRK